MSNFRYATTAFVVCAMVLSGVSVSVSAQDKVPQTVKQADLNASDILGNPDYTAMSFGGFRDVSQENVPTVDELKEDLLILSSMGIKILRTYKTQKFPHAENLLKGIDQLRKADPNFEMYVMLGVWIDCEGAWTDSPNHEAEDLAENTAEIEAAVRLANRYPKTVKIIAVGNEAMVHWAGSYFVRPNIILKWVKHLQNLKQSGELPGKIWITSSDNFASWGGGDAVYHTDDLKELIRSVDFVSIHSYPFHDTHYNASYWLSPKEAAELSPREKADKAMARAIEYAINQYQETSVFIKSVAPDKPVHIGETGWASQDHALYGAEGSGAADEYKQKLYYDGMREWTQRQGISCFYFEAFDEPWKDSANPGGSENHFGLFTVDGKAKYAIWDQVETAGLSKLKRDDSPIGKTNDGVEAKVLDNILEPAAQPAKESKTVNKNREIGQPVDEDQYLVCHASKRPNQENGMTYPSALLKPNVWEGTCKMSLSDDHIITVTTGSDSNLWWGCGLEIQAYGKGENLSEFSTGKLHFEIKGTTQSSFNIGFQTGQYQAGTQTNNYAAFGPGSERQLTQQWKTYSIDVAKIQRQANFSDLTSLLYLQAERGGDGETIQIRNVYYSK